MKNDDYIKLEDAINKMDEWFCEPYTPTKLLSNLPTIEVSEDNANAVDGIIAKPSDWNDLLVPKVSEDCISRDWVYNALTKVTAVTPTQIDMLSDFTDIIKNAPSVAPTAYNLSAVEDCISREYMLRALNGYGKDWQEDCEIADVIRNAPSVVPTTEQSSKVGEWIKQGISPYEGIQRCSLCDEIYNITEEFNYCPNCGAKMKG